jgi:hypothetical protein
MRFKSIFWLFNIVVILALILISTASFFILEKNSAALFWENMWLLLLLFVLMIAALDFYFIRNWQLFSYLEQEDWPALLAWLEERLYEKGRLNRPYANLLINTALSVSNLDAVKKLETEIRQRKPDLMKTLGVSLGIPVLLEQNWDAVERYFGPLADNPGTKRRDWAIWCRALASGSRRLDDLMNLLEGKDISVRLLSVQILTQYESQLSEEQNNRLKLVKDLLKSTVKGSSGERALQRSREDHLMAVVLSSRVNEVRKAILGETL